MLVIFGCFYRKRNNTIRYTDIGKEFHIDNLEDHPSIQKIKQNLPPNTPKIIFPTGIRLWDNNNFIHYRLKEINRNW